MSGIETGTTYIKTSMRQALCPQLANNLERRKQRKPNNHNESQVHFLPVLFKI